MQKAHKAANSGAADGAETPTVVCRPCRHMFWHLISTAVLLTRSQNNVEEGADDEMPTKPKATPKKTTKRAAAGEETPKKSKKSKVKQEETDDAV